MPATLEKTQLKTEKIIKPPRQSNLELLRILSAMMIIGCHFVTFGNFQRGGFTAQSMFFGLLSPIFGYGGVCVFVLLSGYFSVKSRFSWERVFRVALETTFYALTIYIGMSLYRGEKITSPNLLKAGLAIFNGYYWFSTIFLGLMLFAPFLNTLLTNLSKKQFRLMLLMLFVTVCLVPNLLNVKWIYNEFVVMVFYYSMAAYVRLHPEPIFEKKWLWAVTGLLSWFGASVVTMWRYTAEKADFSQYYTPSFADKNGVLAFLFGLSLFLLFRAVKLPGSGSSKIINTIASTAFGVYMIHTHPNVVSKWLFVELFKSSEQRDWDVVYTAGFAIVTVFALCCVIDLVRQYLLENPFFWVVNYFKKKKNTKTGS